MLKKIVSLALAAAFVSALAACKPAEPGKNVPECKSGDACDYTKGT